LRLLRSSALVAAPAMSADLSVKAPVYKAGQQAETGEPIVLLHPGVGQRPDLGLPAAGLRESGLSASSPIRDGAISVRRRLTRAKPGIASEDFASARGISWTRQVSYRRPRQPAASIAFRFTAFSRPDRLLSLTVSSKPVRCGGRRHLLRRAPVSGRKIWDEIPVEIREVRAHPIGPRNPEGFRQWVEA